MTRTATRLIPVLALILGIGLAVEAAVKVRTQHDKSFDFRSVRTWAWHPSGAGQVIMALTPEDDPAAMKARFGPVIEDAIGVGLANRSLTLSDTPQVHVTYYVLITASVSSQTMGQFVPSVPEWGLPPFTGATQAMRVFEQGSLLIDVSSVASNAIVWRGMAQAELHRDRAPTERDTRLREAVVDLLKKLPRTS